MVVGGVDIRVRRAAIKIVVGLAVQDRLLRSLPASSEQAEPEAMIERGDTEKLNEALLILVWQTVLAPRVRHREYNEAPEERFRRGDTEPPEDLLADPGNLRELAAVKRTRDGKGELRS